MVHMVACILVWVGAINWGLVGLGGLMGGDWNLVHMLLGSMPMLENIVYLLVGVAGVYEVATHKSSCKVCGGSGAAM